MKSCIVMNLGLAAMLASVIAAPGQAGPGFLDLETTISLGRVTGRIDHMAIDRKRGRLFIAELGNNSVGVVDLASRRILKRLTGFDEPQGIAYDPMADRLYVANGGDGTVRIVSAELAPLGAVKLGEDADNIRVDAAHVLVGYGDGAIAVLDNGKKVADIPLAAHPESFESDPEHGRLFVNEPKAGLIAVIDSKTGRQLGSWRMPGLDANFPMALDAAGHRLFVIYRNPPTLAVFDAAAGTLRARAPTCGDADDIFFDAKRRRIYISCGAGVLAVVNAADERLAEVARLPTRKGARTALLVAELDRLFVAVPASSGKPAEIRVYDLH
jgi:DNA-binding beta-propeller fold protein YncE